jgi:hypothetical protein
MVQTMPDILVTFAAFVGILTPLIVACTEVVKRSVKNYPVNLVPILSIAVGLGLGSLAWVFTDLNATWRLWGGLIAGLAACGLYDVAKFTSNTFTKPKL